MSTIDNLQVNCPSCTIINSIPISMLEHDCYCNTCSSLLFTNNGEVLNQINEANKKEEIINENYLKAYEEIPSSLIPSKMIYLDTKIEGNEIRFLVDTGAQVSLLPLNIIKILRLEHLLDQRIAGELKGVGSDRIMGKIHYLEVELPCGIIPCSFTVCENEDLIPILGIDMMQQMGLILDFSNRSINIGKYKINM